MESNTLNSNPEPLKIGGWLLLVAVGLFLSPIKVLTLLLTSHLPLFLNGNWQLLTSPTSENYIPHFDILLIGEILGNLVAIGLGIYLLTLFFRKKHTFPKLYVLTALYAFVFIVIDSFLGTLIIPNVTFWDIDTAKGIFQSLFSLLVWGTYLYRSDRCRKTFIN